MGGFLLSLAGCAGTGVQHVAVSEPVVTRVTLRPPEMVVQTKTVQPEAIKPRAVKPTPILLSKDRALLRRMPNRLWGGGAQESRWALITLKAIDTHGRDLLTAHPKDIQNYCPGYAAMGVEARRQFWATFISSLAQFESNYDPTASHQERFNDVKGKPVVSRGLLQLSIESGNSYGCGLQTGQELHNPARNLVCGVRILNRWVGQSDRVITDRQSGKWLGAARYWSPFRNESKRSKIASETASMPMCRAS